MALQLGGLASGVDTELIIQQLMALERRPETKLKLKQRQVETRQNALRDISTRLTNLKNAADALKSVATWTSTQSVDSSDTSKATVRRTGSAGPGGYSLDVQRLARAEQRTFTYTKDASNATQITIGGVAVDIAADSSIQQAADAINAKAGISVYATVVGDEGAGTQRLILSNRSTGDVRLNASGSTIAEDAGKEILGQDASYSLDGGATWVSSASNVLTTAIGGVEVTLKGVTPAGAPVTINIGAAAPDKEAVKAKVKAFVDQYNSTIEFINGKLNEKRVVNPETEADALKGVLQGDSMLRSLTGTLRNSLLEAVGADTTMDQLAEIGISTGASAADGAVNKDAVAGRLVLDETKLAAALDSKFSTVKDLLGAGTATNGLAQRFAGLIDPFTATGGSLSERIKGASSEVTRIRDQLTLVGKRLERKEQLLRMQFERMEEAMSRSQAQSGWLGAQLSSF